MFNLGFMEIVVVGVLALLLIGPKQLPDVARMLGRLIVEFKKATSELSGGLLEDVKKDLQNPLREGINKINEEIHKVKSEVSNVATYNPRPTPKPPHPSPADMSVPEKIISEQNESKS